MALYNFHRVLILAATLFFLAFAVYSLAPAAVGAKAAANWTMGVAACVATLIGAAYFVYFNIRLRRLQAQGRVS